MYLLWGVACGSSAHFVMELFVFLLLHVKGSLPIQMMGPLSDVFSSIFVQSVVCLLSLLMLSFADVYNFHNIDFITSFFHESCPRCVAKKVSPHPRSSTCPLCNPPVL